MYIEKGMSEESIGSRTLWCVFLLSPIPIQSPSLALAGMRTNKNQREKRADNIRINGKIIKYNEY